jgi:NADP-dependent 3-hydroxy acid dehydrogenase YdfG
VNVRGVFLANKAVMPRLIEQGQGGSMINISSTGSSRPRPGLVWYNASKASISNVLFSPFPVSEPAHPAYFSPC